MANSVDPDQTASLGAVWSWSALLAYAVLPETLGYNILWQLLYVHLSALRVQKVLGVWTPGSTHTRRQKNIPW